MKTCLVIGASSFLGRHLCIALLEKGFTVTGTFHKQKDNLPEGITVLSLQAALEVEGYHSIYIVAAYIPRDENPNQTQKLFDANISLVSRICARQHAARIVFCSSVSVYGKQDSVTSFNENTLAAPTSSYGLSKLWGEYIVSQQEQYAIVRFSSLFGEGMYPNTFLPSIIKNALETKEIVLYGKGTRMQNYLEVTDAARYLIAAGFCKQNGIFLAVHPDSYTNLAMAKKVCDEVPETRILFKGEDETPSASYENAQTQQVLSISSHESMPKSIKKLVRWIKK